MDGARHLDLDRLGAASRVRTRAGRFEGAEDRAACDGPWRRRVHQLGVVLVRARIALRTAPPGATAPVSSPRRGDGPQDRLLAITQPGEVTDGRDACARDRPVRATLRAACQDGSGYERRTALVALAALAGISHAYIAAIGIAEDRTGSPAENVGEAQPSTVFCIGRFIERPIGPLVTE